MKTSIKKIIAGAVLVLLMSVPATLTAQIDTDPDPGCGPECPPQDPACCVPIDGGLSLLIAAGIGLGAKKAYDRKKAAIKNAE